MGIKKPFVKGKEIVRNANSKAVARSGMVILVLAFLVIIGFGANVGYGLQVTVSVNQSLHNNSGMQDAYASNGAGCGNNGDGVCDNAELQFQRGGSGFAWVRPYIKHNISDLVNSAEQIISANIELETRGGTDSMEIGVFEIFRDHLGWNETTITWNNQICGTNTVSFNASCNNTPLSSRNISSLNRYNFSVTKIINESLDNTKNYHGIFGFLMNISRGSGSSGDLARIDSSETTTANNQPQLYMTYAPKNAPELFLQEPKNVTYNLSIVTLNYTLGDLSGVSACVRDLDGINTTITNCVNQTLNEVLLGESSHKIILWVNDTYNNVNFTNISFTFTHTPQLSGQMNRTGEIPKYNVSENVNVSGTLRWDNLTNIIGTGDSLGRFNVSIRWLNTNNATIRLANFSTISGSTQFWDNFTMNNSAEVGLYWVQLIGHTVQNNTNRTTAPLNIPFNLTGINYACTNSNFVTSPGNYTMGNRVQLQSMCNITAGSGDMTFAFDRQSFDNNSGQVFQGTDYTTLMASTITRSDITWTSNPSFSSYLARFNFTVVQNITIPSTDCPTGSSYFTNYCINDENISSTETKYEIRFKVNVSNEIISNTTLILPMPISFFTDFTSGTRSGLVAYVNGSSNDTSVAFNASHVNVTVGTNYTTSSLHQGEWIVAVNYTITTSSGGGGGSSGGGGGGGGGGTPGGVCGNGICDLNEGFLTCAKDCGLFQILSNNESFVVNRPNIFTSIKPGTSKTIEIALSNYADLNLSITGTVTQVEGDQSFNWGTVSIDQNGQFEGGSGITFSMSAGSSEIPTIKVINLTITVPAETQLRDYRFDVKFNANGVDKSALVKVTVRDIENPTEILFTIGDALQGFFTAELAVPYLGFNLPYWFITVAVLLTVILLGIGLNGIFKKI